MKWYDKILIVLTLILLPIVWLSVFCGLIIFYLLVNLFHYIVDLFSAMKVMILSSLEEIKEKWNGKY